MSSSEKQFQSTPPARGATGDKILALTGDIEISIHAPREGGDCIQIFV